MSAESDVVATMAPALSGLARRLLADGLIDEPGARAAVANADRAKIPLVRHLVSSGVLDSRSIAIAAAEEFGVPLLDLDAFDCGQCPTQLVDTRLVTRHNVLPLYRRGNRLFLAVSDPTDLGAFDEIKFHTGVANEPVVVEENKLARAIAALVAEDEASKAELPKPDDSGLDNLGAENAVRESPEAELAAADETPVVRFVNRIFHDAIRAGASDIHVEPYEKACRVRFRTDGVLQEITRPPAGVAGRIASRIKIMSGMDISERRLPQDGRIKMKVSDSRAIDFRVNTLPTLWGEKIVLRVLDPARTRIGIDGLGYEEEQKQQYLKALQRHQGMILVTGPTGSGKTVSLYAGIDILNTPERNISTAEDPVEINLEGVNQVLVNTRIGLTFAETLRAFLRQDPDVVMVGEIRDPETAEIAVKAAQTGHLVLSTLHTNSATETLTRLRNMGVPGFNLATSVSLIIAQRLVRRLCARCRERVRVPGNVLLEAGFEADTVADLMLYRAVGCERCHEGYKGRVGIYEVLPISDAIARIIMLEGNSLEIAEAARREGFLGLRQAALLKVARGLTSLDEANRLT